MKGFMLNGEFVAGTQLTIEPHQPYFAHGHGLFETLRAHRGRPCFLNPHVDRMAAAARELGLDCPFDRESARRQVVELLERTGLGDARVKLHLLVKDDGTCDSLVTAEEVPPLEVFGERVAVGRAAPRFNGMTALPGLKTMNYMVNRMAEEEGRRRGFAEVLFTLPDGTVTEGTRSTLFVVRGGVLATPSLELPILPGVTRAVILRLAAEAGVRAEECRLSFAEVAAADEGFLSGSVGGIRPVTRVEDRELPAAPGPVTARLAEAYFALYSGPGELPDGPA